MLPIESPAASTWPGFDASVDDGEWTLIPPSIEDLASALEAFEHDQAIRIQAAARGMMSRRQLCRGDQQTVEAQGSPTWSTVISCLIILCAIKACLGWQATFRPLDADEDGLRLAIAYDDEEKSDVASIYRLRVEPPTFVVNVRSAMIPARPFDMLPAPVQEYTILQR